MPTPRFTKAEENRAYYTYLEDMLGRIGQFDAWKAQVNQRRAENGQPAVQDLHISDEEFESAEKLLEDALRKGLILPDLEIDIALGADCFALYKALSETDRLLQGKNHLHIYQNGQYQSYSLEADGHTTDDKTVKLAEAAAVYPYVKSRVLSLTNDLLDARHFWLEGSPEPDEFTQAMQELGSMLRYYTALERGNDLGHRYDLRDMVNDLTPAYQKMEQFLQQAGKDEALDPREASVREAMNGFKVLYDALKAASARQPDPHRPPFSAVDLQAAEQRNADPLTYRLKEPELSEAEKQVLDALYPERIDTPEKYRRFWTDVNTGKLRVLGRDGQEASPENALAEIVDNPDRDRDPIFRLSGDGKTFEGKVITIRPSYAGAETTSYFAEPSNAGADTMEKRLILQELRSDLKALEADLQRAGTVFGPSEKRKAMHDELTKALENLPGPNTALAEEFPYLLHNAAQAAASYIADKAGQRMDDRQVDRLCVAHRIVVMEGLLRRPDLTHAEYLRNMYAEKVFLDGIADIHARAHSLADAFRIEPNEARQAMVRVLTDYTSPKSLQDAMDQRRQDIMASNDFTMHTTILGTELRAGDLKKLLREDRETTCKALDTRVNILQQHWKEVEKEAGVGPYGWVGKYGEHPDPTPEQTPYQVFLEGMLKALDRFDEWNALSASRQAQQGKTAAAAEKYQKAEKLVEEAFGKGLILDDNGRAIPGSTRCAALFERIRPATADEHDVSYLHVYRNGSFSSVEVANSGAAALTNQVKFYGAAAVYPYLKGRVNELTADLLSTQHFWVNSTPEYMKASEALVELSKKFDDPEFIRKNFSDLEKAFQPAVRAMEQYQEAKGESASLSSRQVTRLKTMSKFQAVYEAIREAAAAEAQPQPEPPTDLPFRTAELKNRVALVNLEAMGPEYVRAGLTNRQLMGEVRGSVPLEQPNAKSSPLFQYSSKELAGKFLYQDRDARKSDLKNRYFISARNAGAQREPLTAEEEKILNSLGLKGETAAQKYESFTELVKKGRIMVFNGNKPAEPGPALRVLAANLRRTDGKPHFYVRKDIKTYEGKTLAAPAEAAQGSSYELKDAPNLPIQTEQLLIYTDAIRLTSQLIRDLSRADGMLPAGTMRQLMSDQLKDIFKRFDHYDMEAGGERTMKEDFFELAETARAYIGQKKGQRLDSDQVDRLCVAHKIVAISDLIWQPNLSYELFLKNLYAEKAYLDGLADGHRRLKNSLDSNLKAVDRQLMSELTDPGKPDRQTVRTASGRMAEEDTGTGRNARAEKRVRVMKTHEFNAHIAGLGAAGLKELLQEKREVTCTALKTKENMQNYYWTEAERAAGVGPGAYEANHASRNQRQAGV